MRIWGWLVVVASMLGLALIASERVDAERRTPPYYASIAAGQARMRTGPARTYPATWLYRRADLPIKVVDIYRDWRKVEDPDGTQGWMLVSLLSDQRTAIVRGTVTPLRSDPNPGAAVLWRAEPGVVGRISRCGGGWCWFDVKGQAGYIPVTSIWGVDPGERME